MKTHAQMSASTHASNTKQCISYSRQFLQKDQFKVRWKNWVQNAAGLKKKYKKTKLTQSKVAFDNSFQLAPHIFEQYFVQTSTAILLSAPSCVASSPPSFAKLPWGFGFGRWSKLSLPLSTCNSSGSVINRGTAAGEPSRNPELRAAPTVVSSPDGDVDVPVCLVEMLLFLKHKKFPGPVHHPQPVPAVMNFRGWPFMVENITCSSGMSDMCDCWPMNT